MSESDKLYPLSKLPIPTRPHVATVWRWATRGVRGVRLETVIVGGRRFATKAACDRFLAALNAPAGVTPPVNVEHDAEDAGAELQRLGA